MDLTALKYFCDSLELGSIRKAAERNFVSSPAISIAIKKLEEELGVSLFEHKKNQFLPTPKAHILFQESQALFKLVSSIKYKINEDIPIKGHWRIGTQQSIASVFFPKLILSLKKQYPELDLTVQTATTKKITEHLRAGTLDAAIILSNVETKDFHVSTLKKGNFFVYGAKNSKASDAFFLTEETKETKSFINAYKKEFQKAPQVLGRISSWSTIKSFAESGVGLTYIPDYLESKKLVRHFKQKKKLATAYELIFLTPKERKTHPINQAICEFAINCFQ